MRPLAPALGLAAIVAANAGWPGVAISQNCEAMSSGPAQTDCFIGRARIQGQQCNIAAGTARRHTDTEFLPKQNRHQPYDKGSPSETKANITKRLV